MKWGGKIPDHWQPVFTTILGNDFHQATPKDMNLEKIEQQNKNKSYLG